MARLGARSTSIGWASHLSAAALFLLPTTWLGGDALIPTVYSVYAWRSEELPKVQQPVCDFFTRTHSRYLNTGQSELKLSS